MGEYLEVNHSSEERNWAMFCHLSALVGYIIPFGHIIAPLVIWLLKKDELSLVDKEGKKSLNFQISITIYALIALVLSFVLIGIPLLIAIGIVQLIFVIIASVKTSKGESYHYPLTIQFLS